MISELILGPKRGPFGAPLQAKTQGNTLVVVLLGDPKWVHFGVIFGSVPGSLLGSALEHLLHRNTSKTKRFWCFGGFGKGLISGHVPAPCQGTFLVILLFVSGTIS